MTVDLTMKALYEPFIRSAIYAGDLSTALAAAKEIERKLTAVELTALLTRYNKLNDVPTIVQHEI